MSPAEAAGLARLANGVIPADQRDQGAAGVRAGEIIAERLAEGELPALHRQGLEVAERLAEGSFSSPLAELDSREIEALFEQLLEEAPAFVAQLRADVVTIYLSDPEVWSRIGFPGPSTESGGYPDFDQPQTSPATPGQ